MSNTIYGLTITRLETAALHMGDFIIIRPVEVYDAEFMHRWNNDPEYSGEYEPYEPSTLDEMLAWIRGDKHNASWYIMEREVSIGWGYLCSAINVVRVMVIHITAASRLNIHTCI